MPEVRHVWETVFNERHNAPNVMQTYYTTESGLNYVSGFPQELSTHIAAAYGVDMSAVDAPDQILDIILYQSHIPDPYLPQNREQDVAWQQGMRTRLVNHREYPPGTEVPVTLYSAESDEQAREAHLLRIAEVKKNFSYVPYIEVDPVNLRSSAAQMFHVTQMENDQVANPLDVYRQNHGVTEEELEKHRAFVKVVRANTLGREVDPKLLERIDDRPRSNYVPPKQDAIVRQSLAIRLNPV